MNIGGIPVGEGKKPLVLIAGVCVIEDEYTAMKTAETLKRITSKAEMPLIFKGSFDKANRSQATSYRGVGIDLGLKILSRIKEELMIPVTTDVHEIAQVSRVSEVVDLIQIPAFLSRQTDILKTCIDSGKPVNVKKGQWTVDMEPLDTNIRLLGGMPIITERGSSVMDRLVVDFHSISKMTRQVNPPVIFLDITHTNRGDIHFGWSLARAGLTFSIDGIFVETHAEPDKAKCDGIYATPLDMIDWYIDWYLSGGH